MKSKNKSEENSYLNGLILLVYLIGILSGMFLLLSAQIIPNYFQHETKIIVDATPKNHSYYSGPTTIDKPKTENMIYRIYDGLWMSSRTYSRAIEKALEYDSGGDWVCVNVESLTFEKAIRKCESRVFTEIFAECGEIIDSPECISDYLTYIKQYEKFSVGDYPDDFKGHWVCVNVFGMDYETARETCRHEFYHEMYNQCENAEDKEACFSDYEIIFKA